MASVGGNLRRRKGRSLRQRAETTGQDHHSPKNAKPRLGKAGLDVWLMMVAKTTRLMRSSRATPQRKPVGGLHDLLSVSEPQATSTNRNVPGVPSRG